MTKIFNIEDVTKVKAYIERINGQLSSLYDHKDCICEDWATCEDDDKCNEYEKDYNETCFLIGELETAIACFYKALDCIENFDCGDSANE